MRLVREPLAGRQLVTPLAALFYLAALVDPGRWWEYLALALPVALFALWQRFPRLLPLLTVVTPPAVVVALWGGGLEPGMFIVSLLALTVAAWEDNRPLAATGVLLSVLTPVVLGFLSSAHVAWGIWILGILFPTVLGLTVRRLERVTAELARARDELAERAVLDERQRIGRDVHDLVGHGLAAVMLHLTGARHVLRRDVDAADEALRTAEEAGRASLQELRRAVDQLRREEDDTSAPAPGLGQVRELVATYRSAGLMVSLEAAGDLAVPPAVGLTAYRIAQQALANAAQHAATARTTVSVDVTGPAVTLAVVSHGAAPGAAVDRGYGLVSMHERARVAGGRLVAGPSAEGWTVRCVLPLDPSGDLGPSLGPEVGR